MIVDVHSHAWEYPQHFGDDFRRQATRARAGVEVDLTVRYEDYRATCPPDTKTIVFGGKARLSDQWVDDRYVADYVAQAPRHAHRLPLRRPDAGRLGARDARRATRSSACAGSSCCRCTPASGPTTRGSTRCGSTRRSSGCPCCCTPARRSSPGAARVHAAAPRRRRRDPLPRREDHHGPPRPPVRGRVRRDVPQAPQRLRRRLRAALPPVPALPLADARAGVRRVGQGAVRHATTRSRPSTHRSTASASSTTCSKARSCRDWIRRRIEGLIYGDGLAKLGLA